MSETSEEKFLQAVRHMHKYGLVSFMDIHLPETHLILSANVHMLLRYAIKNCTFASIRFADDSGVTEIPQDCFYNVHTTDIMLPKSLKNICETALRVTDEKIQRCIIHIHSDSTPTIHKKAFCDGPEHVVLVADCIANDFQRSLLIAPKPESELGVALERMRTTGEASFAGIVAPEFDLVLSSNVTKLRAKSFHCCVFKSISLVETSIETLPNCCFKNVDAELFLPASLKKIERYAISIPSLSCQPDRAIHLHADTNPATFDASTLAWSFSLGKSTKVYAPHTMKEKLEWHCPPSTILVFV